MFRRSIVALTVLLLSLGPVSKSFAFQEPRPEDVVLPDFDIRLPGSGPVAMPLKVRTALFNLQAQLPTTLQARFHPLTGGVRLLSAQEGVITAARSGSPQDIALDFLAQNLSLFGLTTADFQNLIKVREYSSFNETITHLFFNEVVGGIRVFEADLRFHINLSGQIVWISSNTFSARSPVGSPRLSAANAIQRAAANIRPELSFRPQLKSGPNGPDQAAVYDHGPFKTDVAVHLMLFPTRQGLQLAWQVYLEPFGFPQAYYILVDATTGQILHRRNAYQYADGVGNVAQSNATQAADPRRPDEHPTGSNLSGAGDPAGGCPPINDYSNRILNTQFRDPATVLFNNGRLAGNNVHVFRMSTGTEGALGILSSNFWHFNFMFNTADSAETHLFFASNFLHDFFYNLGFDEAAGNFQENNFGRGGQANDSLNANARESGRTNAFFLTPPDGQRPTMGMFLFDGRGCWAEDVDGDGTTDLDSDYDSDIFIHEYHHGVSRRLNPHFGGEEAGAMGEGGGDFFGYSINNNTNLGEYAEPPIGRRQVNDRTYGSWTSTPFSVHFNGEIWANTLWDLRERFRIDQVNGSEQAGINELHRLYIDGLKLSPANPTMLDMRNAMLQADLNRNPDPSATGGSKNYSRMWQAFAGRGMGVNARDTNDTGNNTVVEDFTTPH